jgi:fido (protein-threonine AMPylation protein)
MNYKEEDIKKYIEIYLNNRRMGVDIKGIILLTHNDIKMKEWLVSEAHKGTEFPFDPSEMINDYTMHLLTIFFILNSSNNMFTYVGENFIAEYVQNESEIEGVNDLSIHGIEEMKGLEAMYRYINSGENEYSTGRMILTDLHEKLYSYIHNGEFARRYRTAPAYLPCSGVELADSYMIPSYMRESDKLFDELYKEADKMYKSEIEDRIHMVNPFLAKLMKYYAELVRIHPFPDGNGRSIRGLVNFLLERGGLPPVYVKSCERGKYHEAMNKAIVEEDYTKLINFYKNKLCDSIEELVIDPFVHALNEYDRREEVKEAKKQKGSNLVRVLKKENEK